MTTEEQAQLPTWLIRTGAIATEAEFSPWYATLSTTAAHSLIRYLRPGASIGFSSGPSKMEPSPVSGRRHSQDRLTIPFIICDCSTKGDMSCRGVLSVVVKTPEMHIPTWYWFRLGQGTTRYDISSETIDAIIAAYQEAVGV